MHFLLLGIDSLIACLAIGAIVDRKWRLPLAALFGTADATFFLIGAGLGWTLPGATAEFLGMGLLLFLGLYLLIVAAGVSRVSSSWAVWVVPWALTLDNLAFGTASDNSLGALLSEAAQQAASSALLAVVGLAAAAALWRGVPAHTRALTRFAGGALMVAAGGMLLLG